MLVSSATRSSQRVVYFIFESYLSLIENFKGGLSEEVKDVEVTAKIMQVQVISAMLSDDERCT